MKSSTTKDSELYIQKKKRQITGHLLQDSQGSSTPLYDTNPTHCTIFFREISETSIIHFSIKIDSSKNNILTSSWFPPLQKNGWDYNITPLKFNIAFLKIGNPKRKLIFQPSCFRGLVKFRGCKSLKCVSCFISATLFLCWNEPVKCLR